MIFKKLICPLPRLVDCQFMTVFDCSKMMGLFATSKLFSLLFSCVCKVMYIVVFLFPAYFGVNSLAAMSSRAGDWLWINYSLRPHKRPASQLHYAQRANHCHEQGVPQFCPCKRCMSCHLPSSSLLHERQSLTNLRRTRIWCLWEVSRSAPLSRTYLRRYLRDSHVALLPLVSQGTLYTLCAGYERAKDLSCQFAICSDHTFQIVKVVLSIVAV